jgi:hypothetical protein
MIPSSKDVLMRNNFSYVGRVTAGHNVSKEFDGAVRV